MIAYQEHPFTALGDPTRRAIFELVAERPRPVGQLAKELPVTRPAVSQHLKVLKSAGLVTDHQEGTMRLYRLNLAGLEAIRTYFDRFWQHALTAFKDAAERPDPTVPSHIDTTHVDTTKEES